MLVDTDSSKSPSPERLGLAPIAPVPKLFLGNVRHLSLASLPVALRRPSLLYACVRVDTHALPLLWSNVYLLHSESLNFFLRTAWQLPLLPLPALNLSSSSWAETDFV